MVYLSTIKLNNAVLQLKGLLLRVIILNWKKWNGRTDIQNPRWFKFSNQFFYDSKLYQLTDEERLFLIYLLCEASAQNNDGVVTLYVEHLHKFLQTSTERAKTCLKKLKQLHIINYETLRRRNGSVTDPCTRIEERRREENIYIAQSNDFANGFDFEFIYKKYPRKLGKQKGLKACYAQIKTNEDYQDLLRAVDRYVEYCKKSVTDPKYIKHFSTFMNSWRDWLESNVGESIKTGGPTWDINQLK